MVTKKYNCELEGLRFRNIVGRYFRVYGKDNLNEKRPIQYVAKEKDRDSILNLIKLFDKYSPLRTFEDELKDLQTEIKVLNDGSKSNLIPITRNKSEFKLKQKEIEQLYIEIEKLKKDMASSMVDVEALISKEVLVLQNQKSKIMIRRNILSGRLQRTEMNIKNKKSKAYSEIESFKTYFPTFNTEQLKKLDSFHDNLTSILKEELQEVKKKLIKEIKELDTEIKYIDDEISSKLEIKSAPTYSLNRLIELTGMVAELEEQNKNFQTKNEVKEDFKEKTSDLSEVKVKITDDICNQINTSLKEMNKEIYTDERRAPNFNIHSNQYTFNTYGDTGTGTAFASLISFDLSLLNLTSLPAIIHDLPLLKNIENNALENIFELYSKQEKQIFIAIDKLTSYSEETRETIENSKVLQLSNKHILFVKNWKNAN